MEDYKTRVRKLGDMIPKSIVDLSVTARKRGQAPTQAFSDFLTHREQGDWAEELVFQALQSSDFEYLPIKYGHSDQIIAGDPGFKKFYNLYQDEIDAIGKRPDILLFKSENYCSEWKGDISQFPEKQLNPIVELAVAGFEIRSSAYLTKKFIPKKERPLLSFTPKIEDLLVVLKWIERFNVPHFYVQVFFDAIYIISFEEVLDLLRNAQITERGIKNKKVIGELNGKPVFAIEKNPKNQYKETVHIFLDSGHLLSNNIEPPELLGLRKELSGGRLLHYVTFHGGKAKIDISSLEKLL